MAQDNLRVSSAVTRKLLSTQAGTFDGAFGISCDTADNPLKLMQLNETTGRYDIVRAVSEEENAAIKTARRPVRDVDCSFSRTSASLCIQMLLSLIAAALVPAPVRRAVAVVACSFRLVTDCKILPCSWREIRTHSCWVASAYAHPS
jgi:hypothetical protein